MIVNTDLTSTLLELLTPAIENRQFVNIFNEDMKSKASWSMIRLKMLTVIRKEILMATYYIGADVHSNNTELAIEKGGKIVDSYSVPTTIPAISTVLDSLQGKKLFAMEEGPMAGWLYRNLHEKVEQFIVSEPRRNKLITCDGDKDDKIDAHKLAVLLRGKFLKAVHHTDDSDRAHLKHWVNLYHDRVRDAVRNINEIRACCRMHGVAIPRKVVRNQAHRHDWLSGLNNPVLREQLRMLWIGYDATKEQVEIAKKQLSSWAHKHRIIKHWRRLPGIRLIRAATVFAYLDTPWRFLTHTAPCSGVSPPTGTLTSAPLLTSRATISGSPVQYSGVQCVKPTAPLALTSAPLAISSSVTSLAPINPHNQHDICQD